MRRGFFIFVATVVGLYLALHLALGSSPVQRRVLDEIQRVLAQYGLELKIESIEFSALTPKIYLNRVSLHSRPGAKIVLPQPLAIDKIKIHFQPLALIYNTLVIEELTLFHPVLAHDSIDRLYRRVEMILSASETSKAKAKPARTPGEFKLVLKKVGAVDALINVGVKEPPLAVRTPSLTVFLQNHAREQFALTVETRNLEIERGPLRLALNQVELDVDATQKSVRVNRFVVERSDVRADVKGVASLPPKGSKSWLPSTMNVSYDFRLALDLVNRLPEWKAMKGPELDGSIASGGILRSAQGAVTGQGKLRYDGIGVDGYRIGSGQLEFQLDEKRTAILSDLVLRYAGGELRSSRATVGLEGRMPIAGHFDARGIQLNGILDSVKSFGAPVRMETDGAVKVEGFLAGPLELKVDVANRVGPLTVLQDDKKGVTDGNVILKTDEGRVDGRMTFFSDRMLFDAQVAILEGSAKAEGSLLFGGDNAKVNVTASKLSLTKLKRIADIDFGGTTDLTCELGVDEGELTLGGSFSVAQGQIAGLELGAVRGKAQFRDGLLAFEDLETPSVEPISGNGFVDFKPARTHYRFLVEARRADVNAVFAALKNQKLGFEAPKGGELAARMTLEGGHDDKGIELRATGQGKNFRWYDENWQSANFTLSYRSDLFELGKVVLFKKSGGLEVKGRFTDKRTSLAFTSHDLKLEDLERFGRAPVAAEVAGHIEMEILPGVGLASGQGEIKLAKTTFRGAPVADSELRISTTKKGIELLGNIGGEGLKGRFVRDGQKATSGELLLYFNDFDFTPITTLFFGKDISTLGDLTATGDLSLSGNLAEWSSLRGSGTITRLNLGFKGTPMTNRDPIRVQVNDGAVQIDRTNLVGRDSQVAVEFTYRPDETIRGSLDGKLDLQFLQPFVPGLDYGTGKVTVGARLSGKPKSYTLIGNLTLDDGIIRLTGLADEFRAVQLQLSASQDRLNVDRFEATVNGGRLRIDGDVKINKFTALEPNLRLSADRISLRTRESLVTRFSGDFTIRGTQAPYLLGGRCRVLDGTLSSFESQTPATAASSGPPAFVFDVQCEARDQFFVKTDIMDAEFRGSFHVKGTTDQVGLLGSAEVLRGTLVFRETRFALGTGTVRFESPDRIRPRFTISGSAVVQEQKAINPAEYEVNLHVFGTPEDYKIRLTSSPPLAEADIISLLLLGITGRTQEGNYMDLGTTVVGQIPIQSKIQSELGFDIKIRSKSQTSTNPIAASAGGAAGNDVSVPSVQIQKDITKKTRVSYSSTLDAAPIREFKIEQMLDDNFSINATAVGNPQGSSATSTNQPTQSYGLDFRYRFSFE